VDTELDKSYLLEFFPADPHYRRTHELLKQPSDETLKDILLEKTHAANLATQSLEEIRTIEKFLSPSAYHQLVDGFETCRNAAIVWRDIAEIYFRPTPDAVKTLLTDSCHVEKQAGKRWPIYPAARGITAYRFAEEAIERGKLCCVSVPSCQ